MKKTVVSLSFQESSSGNYQSTFTFSRLAIGSLEQGVKYVQS